MGAFGKHLISLGVQGVGNLGGQIFNFLTQKKMLARQRQHQMALAEYAHSKDIEMWNMANQYNLPQNQMQRLRDAGLNPALVYGKGAQTLASAQLPKYNAPTVDYHFNPGLRAPDMIGQYNNLRLGKARADNLTEQTRLANEKTVTEMTRRHVMNMQATKLDIGNKQAQLSYDINREFSRKERSLNYSRGLFDFETTKIYDRRTRSLKLKNMKAQLNRAIFDLRMDKRYSPQERERKVDLLKQSYTLNQQKMYLNSLDADIKVKQAEQMQKMIELRDLDVKNYEVMKYGALGATVAGVGAGIFATRTRWRRNRLQRRGKTSFHKYKSQPGQYVRYPKGSTTGTQSYFNWTR